MVCIFTDRENGGREVVFEMLDRLVVIVLTIESVLVGAYPVVAVRTTHDTGNTCCSNGILSAQLVTHIAERHHSTRLHIDSLLEQAQPYITIDILINAIYLGSSEVNLATIVRIINVIAIIGIIDTQSQSVVANHDMSTAIGVEGRDVLSTCGIDMARRVANQFKHTGMSRCNEDAALMVLTDVAYHTGFLF